MSDFDLVMPFVVCKSQGGPHDDDAFVAGWRLGQIDQLLSVQGAGWFGMIREEDLPQLELIAMRYACEVSTVETPGPWLVAQVTPVAS